MCDPLTAIVAASTVVSIGGSIIEHKAQNQAKAANDASALASLKIQDHELSLREVEERISGGQQVEQGSNQVLGAQGDIRANAAASGISGMTVDALLHDTERQGAAYKQSVGDNTDATVAQLERAKDEAAANAQSRVNSVLGANPLVTGLKIAGAGLDFAAYKIGKKPKGT